MDQARDISDYSDRIKENISSLEKRIIIFDHMTETLSAREFERAGCSIDDPFDKNTNQRKTKYFDYPDRSKFNDDGKTVPRIFGYRSLGEFRRYVKHYLHNTSNSYIDFLYTLCILFANNRLYGHDAKYIESTRAHQLQGFFFDFNAKLVFLTPRLR